MAQQSGSLLSDLREGISNSPVAQRLLDEAQGYVQARARSAVRSTTEKVGGLSDRLTDAADNGGSLRKGAEKLAEGKSPASAAASAGLAKVGEKVKGMLGGGKGSSGSKTVSIMEQIDVGVPRSVAYNQWTQFQDFQQFAKGVKSASQEDDTTVQWRAKIAFSTRSWKSTITEQVPDERIAWKSEGEKGTVDGVVTFHELAPNLTRVLLDLEYHPQGLFEKTGNLWRAQGRRARLDLKKFRQFLMGEGEETGAWRGEVRDGKVVKRKDGEGGRSKSGDGDRKRSSRSRPAESSGNGSKSAGSRSGNGSKSAGSRNGGKTASKSASSNSGGKTASKSAGSNSGGNGGSGKSSTDSPKSRSGGKTAAASRPSSSKSSTGATSSTRRSTTSAGRSTAKKTAAKKSAPAKKSAAAKQSAPAKKTASRSASSSRGRTRAKAGAGSK